jgi:hypothetical protein
LFVINGIPCGQGNKARGGVRARGELMAWEEIKPLIVGIRLVLREARNRALREARNRALREARNRALREARNREQRATIQVRAYLFVESACHSPHVYKYIILCAFFHFCRSKINHMSEYGLFFGMSAW